MGGSDCLRGALCATFATLWIVERRRRWRLAKLDRTVGKKYLPHWLDFILMARFLYEHSFPAQFVWNQELYCKSTYETLKITSYFITIVNRESMSVPFQQKCWIFFYLVVKNVAAICIANQTIKSEGVKIRSLFSPCVSTDLCSYINYILEYTSVVCLQYNCCINGGLFQSLISLASVEQNISKNCSNIPRTW